VPEILTGARFFAPRIDARRVLQINIFRQELPAKESSCAYKHCARGILKRL